MARQPVNICYYPTKVLLVDDEETFVAPVALDLATHKHIICEFYTNPEILLHFLNEDYKPARLTDHCLSPDEDATYHRIQIDFHTRAIQQILYNPQRFEEITVVVSDYAMPNLNGAQLFQQLQSKVIQKLLLTGEGDQALAVKLFNESVIQRFLRKDSGFIDELANNIHELQHAAFAYLSRMVLTGVNNLPTQHSLLCLEEPAYIELFNEIYQQSQAVEYYLLDNQGSFLFLDKDANAHWLVMVCEEEMDAYHFTATYSDVQVPDILRALARREVVPFFFSEQDWRTPPDSWYDFLHPAKLLVGKTNYYYAHLINPPIYNIQRNKILTYQEYLNKCYKPRLDNLKVG